MADATYGTRLVIVESPAKARTIAGYLGAGYIVESSIGHIRDLPNNAAEVPAKYRGLPWARLGVDVDNGFEPVYVVPADKKAHIAKLRKLLAGADELLLATDEDREGEAIAWHLLDELKPRVPVRRMVFHEITPAAIRAAVDSPRDIDRALVDAQETRRILDRLYGYEVSPVLWKKVMSRLSAGRVQSVATRLVVDRERERIAHRSASYWDLQAVLDADPDGTRAADPRQFPARLVALDGTRVATGRDFTPAGMLVEGRAVVHLDEARTGALAAALRHLPFTVRSVEAKPYTRKPYPPFRTTTLQQEASRKLGFGAAVTMQLAQRLYENGFITYMRTDSVTLSTTAVTAARDQVRELYGGEYLPDQPRTYTSKVKNAQEAHEAIRPSGERFRTPGETGLTGDQYRVYELIWMRTVASQMRDAQGRSVQMRLGATISGGTADGTDAELAASGRVITFHGFLRAYVEDLDDPSGERDDRETRLPDLTEGDEVAVARLEAEGHETRPPARFTEATLVRELEEREIGRPSTYASIMRTILDRGYVYKKGTAMVPSWVAFSVTRLLELHFTRLVDYDFTARLEDVLDEVAGGREDAQRVLGRFWFGGDGPDGDGGTGLKRLVGELGDIDARELATFPIRDDDGSDTAIVLRVGRYGPYVEDGSGARGNVPDDLPPDELTPDAARALLANPAGAERELGTDPASGHVVVSKNGRYGPYVTEQLPDGTPKSTKARTGSLFKDMDPATVTLDDALRLLSLPRTVGSDPESGEPITAQNGRYGPYLKKGTDSRSLETEQQIFAITQDEARAIYAQPKQHGRRAAKAPLRELGDDPGSGKAVTVKDGRFGPYVTDGETNATLRKGDEPGSMTIERATELLAERRAREPAPRKRTATKTARKTTKKATKATKPAKKAAKTTGKKAAPRKAAAATSTR